MNARTLRLLPSGQSVPMPRRIESEPLEIHDARIAAIRRLGVFWQKHPSYPSPARHSVFEAVWQPARAEFLSGIAARAAADRASNATHQAWIKVRAVLGEV